MLDVENFQVMLADFEEEAKAFFNEALIGQDAITVIRATTDSMGEPIFEVALEHGVERSDLDDELAGQESVAVRRSVNGRQEETRISFVHQSRVRAMSPHRLCAGSGIRPFYRLNPPPAPPRLPNPNQDRYRGRTGGTFGWAFLVDVSNPDNPNPENLSPFVLSAWHATHFGTPTGNLPNAVRGLGLGPAYLGGLPIWYLQPPGEWDLSITEVDDFDSLSGEFINDYQSAGSPRPYPLQVRAVGSPPTVGAIHYKVGKRYPYYASGKLISLAHINNVLYPDGQRRSLQNQLEFDMLVGRGDSGSVVVDSASNLISGVIVAATTENRLAYANQLYLRDWKTVGTHLTVHNNVLPIVDPSNDPDWPWA
jgi:hypothetical protein